MKQLLFLLLFPWLCVAQYTGNGNQKITLGEQSTADGLVYRGLAADTTRKPSVDTMAFILLDTNTNIIWQYKKATNNAWTRVGGSISSGITGTLPVANGGTNTSTLTANKVMVGNGTSGVLTPTDLHWDNTNSRLGIGTASPSYKLDINAGTDIVRINGTTGDKLLIYNSGNNSGINGFNFSSDIYPGLTFDSRLATLGGIIGKGRLFYNSIATGYGANSLGGAVILQADNAIQFSTNVFDVRLTIASTGAVTINDLAGSGSRAVNASATGVLSASSSILIKENVENINYGLSDVLKLKPVIFNYIDKDKWGEGKELGFIAEDVMNIIPESTGTMNNSDIYFDLQKLIPVLTKAIQEQQALIKALEQRILILENK